MKTKKHFYFIGIKGSGMSALANVIKKLGHDVEGSDIDAYVFTERNLRAHDIGIHHFVDEMLEKVTAEYPVDIVVRGVLFDAENNKEVAYAEKNGIQILTYYEMLRDFANEYTSVAISGTHGKTTTTGMIVSTFADEQVAYLIGDGTGSADAASQYFLFESCEYKRHFLWYTPDYQIINNIDFDHPDYFKDTDDVIDAFVAAAKQAKKAVIAYGDDENVRKLAVLVEEQTPIFMFGEAADNDYIISKYKADASGISFSLTKDGELLGAFNLPFYGKHMMLNAVATLVVADLEGKNLAIAAANLAQFSGVDRRFNVKKVGDFTIVDDYAHHPNEIRVTIDAARQQFKDKKLIAVFQPHTFSRTNTLAVDFAKALDLADEVYITDIFTSARESGAEVYPSAILELLPTAHHITLDNLDVLTEYKDAVLIFMGAGNIQDYINITEKCLKKV